METVLEIKIGGHRMVIWDPQTDREICSADIEASPVGSGWADDENPETLARAFNSIAGDIENYFLLEA